MKQPKGLLSCLTGDEGFTVIETLVSMVIFLVAIVSAWGLAATVSLNFAKTGGKAIGVERVLQFDAFFRESVSRVSIPFWAGTQWESLYADTSHIIIPWLYGDRDKTFEIEFTDDAITAKTDSAAITVNGISLFALGVLKDASNANIGLEVRYAYDGVEYLTQALFGAWSLIPGG
jgi:hypothetical protein